MFSMSKQTLSKKINSTIIFFVLLFCLLVAVAIYWSTESFTKQRLEYDMSIAESTLETNMNFEKTSLLQTLLAVKSNREFVRIFKTKNKEALLAATKPFFDEIRAKHQITHFYFISPDKKCFLRVHKPEQYGDTIERVTLKGAIESKAEFVGLEMGRNFFSLRAVTPVYDNGELVGYVELGREIDHFFPNFKRQTGFDISLVLDGQYIESYKKSMKSEIVPDGERVGSFVILNSSNAALAKDILLNSKNTDFQKVGFEDVGIGDRDYFCYHKKAKDARGEYAGIFLITAEHTALHQTAHRQYLFIFVSMFVAVLLLAYVIRRGIEKEILVPIGKIRAGIVNFFAYIRGDAQNITYIEPMQNNEIGAIGMTLNESMEETIQILEENKRNEAYLLQKSRVVALGEMIANIAHHWRQPLNVISITAQDMLFAKKEGDFDDEYIDASVRRITDTARDLSGTLDRLRNFYGQKSFKEEFCVEDEIRNTLAFFGDYLENSNIDIEFDTDKEHIVKNYKNELSQTLLSILQNSKEAIEAKKGGHGQITIKVYEKNKTVAVSIVDNGGGMDEKTLHQIFDPYFSTKFKSNDVGLGLYLAKVSVEKNMGGMLVAKKVKDGLEMVIELPISLNDAV